MPPTHGTNSGARLGQQQSSSLSAAGQAMMKTSNVRSGNRNSGVGLISPGESGTGAPGDGLEKQMKDFMNINEVV